MKLSAKEYDLLRLLIAHSGRAPTHGFLLMEVWGPAHAGDVQYLRVYIRQLREKLEADSTRPQLILTGTGVGYRLKADRAASDGSALRQPCASRYRNQKPSRQSAVPWEWSRVPLFVIDEAVERIKDETIGNYIYHPEAASLMRAAS